MGGGRSGTGGARRTDALEWLRASWLSPECAAIGRRGTLSEAGVAIVCVSFSAPNPSRLRIEAARLGTAGSGLPLGRAETVVVTEVLDDAVIDTLQG